MWLPGPNAPSTTRTYAANSVVGMALPYANEPEVCETGVDDDIVDADVVEAPPSEERHVPDVVRPDAVAQAVDAMRIEMSERDGELRDVLGRLGELYGRIADAQVRLADDAPDRSALDEHALRALLRSTEHLATVTEASVDRITDVTRSLERMAESMQGVATRVDRLVRRADESETHLERLVQATESLRDEVGDLQRGQQARRRPPRLRAVGDAAPGEPGGPATP